MDTVLKAFRRIETNSTSLLFNEQQHPTRDTGLRIQSTDSFLTDLALSTYSEALLYIELKSLLSFVAEGTRGTGMYIMGYDGR